jgi:4-alpha-glucanotransferase
MPIGVSHGRAVGVDSGGADAWTLQDGLAGEVRVGAPPDVFD